MRLRAILAGVLPAFLACAATARAQDAATLAPVLERLEALERQNADLQEQVRALRAELDTMKQAGATNGQVPATRLDVLEEQVALQAGRLAEHDQIKVEGSQRAPIRLTGMALFNAFYNTPHANPGFDYPAVANINANPTRAGASLNQSVFGVEFQTPEAVLGGQIRGSLFMDLTGATNAGARPLQVNMNPLPRLRTAWVEARWGSRAILVGQDKLVFSPREPNSLAKVTVSPLAGQGNLYGWRPQVRLEQTLKLGERQEVHAQIAVLQTLEEWARTQDQFASTLELRRPSLEGYGRFSHQFENGRRVEIGSGFHRSATHVARTSVPSRVYALDWFVNPVPRVEIAGFWFAGQNVAKMGARAMHGVAISTPSPAVLRVVPIRSRGGWTQVTFLATPRLSFNFSGGQEDPDDRDLLPGMIARNRGYVANTFYRLAPNVVVGAEVSQARTWYTTGQRPRFNHYDLYMAYLF